MNPLEAMIARHEGFRGTIYEDSVGLPTIGYGRCLATNPLTKDEALYLMQSDITKCRTELVASFAWFPPLDLVRQAALIDLCFNIGVAGILGFKKMVSALSAKDYQSAAAELMNSKYAKQVGGRAKELAEMLRTGQWQKGY